MKKFIALLLSLVMIFAFAACGAKQDAGEEPTSSSEETTKWKDIMGSIEKPTDAPRVVIFQNFIKYDESVDLFKDFGGKPAADGKTYKIATIAKVWTKGATDSMTVVDKDGQTAKVSAADLETATVTVNEDGTGTIKIGKKEIKNFKYLITDNKEALLFVIPEETITMPDLFKDLGYDGCKNVYVTASDSYWCRTEEVKETEGSEIRGTLSGAVNCNLTVENKGGAGKLNDLFYIDIVE